MGQGRAGRDPFQAQDGQRSFQEERSRRGLQVEQTAWAKAWREETQILALE